jgi:hypothetical protein
MKTLRNGFLAIAALLVLALVAAGPAAAAKDRNHDKIPDRWEKRHHLSLNVNQAKRDQDGDRLNNRGEFVSRSDPRDADTDDDGVEDGSEDGGVISSFDGTTLSIDLLNGGTVTGTVDANTEVKCGDEVDQDSEDPDSNDETEDRVSTSATSGGGDEGDDDATETEDDSSDDDSSDDETEDDETEDGNCSVADLAVGVAVHEASLRVANGDAVFEEIELAK